MRLRVLFILLCVSAVCAAKNVTIRAVNKPAAEVFRSIVEQTGKNFVYSSDLLTNMRVTVNVKDKSLKYALSAIFDDTNIEYKIKGKNIILKRRPKPKVKHKVPKLTPKVSVPTIPTEVDVEPTTLKEVVVVSRLEAPAVETAEIGAKKLTAQEILSTPTLFGESDVIKALMMQPGVTESTEAMAGMNVHGGNADENLYMLDNVPLYQVNHFGGLFSAFNVETIKYIDFFKSSIPAKYDGRLSSYLDVRTKSGSQSGHHGTVRVGLTSGAFNIDGPIGKKTTYSVALRNSWFDLLTVPILAIGNAANDDKIRFRYSFCDLNGKVTHRFSSNASGFLSVYFGNDNLITGWKYGNKKEGDYENTNVNMNWGNIVAQAGFNYRFRPQTSAEFTAAYTRFFSSINNKDHYIVRIGNNTEELKSKEKSSNNINDWIIRGDFDWNPNDSHHVRFGAGYTLHSFQPGHNYSCYDNGTAKVTLRDTTRSLMANEANLYIEDDFLMSEHFRMNAGIHGSLFNIKGKTHFGIGPRLSVSYRPTDNWAVKAAYSRTNQYVHQLCQTYMSLPTDRWVPITGELKAAIADKVAVGGYWQSSNGMFAVSIEGYYKWMRNLVDYRDEYYLYSVEDVWSSRLCNGRGTAKGVDIKFEKVSGRLTGHISYSLAWADRTFPDKNGGRTFPARFDQRHTINIMLNWNINDKVSLNAAWTGHSGNRFTLLPQVWESPDFISLPTYDGENDPLKAQVNNYQLPFYHRLDLSCTVRNKRGYWSFGLYNAYCHMNTVAIRRTYNRKGIPVFQKVKFLPIIPSISYTWQF